MVLPIVAYGDPILKKVATEIQKDHKDLEILLKNMFETMHKSHGVGLAAPQIGQSIRLFIVDANPFADEYPEAKDFTQVFINPVMIEETGTNWVFNEGCLSIPGIREDVTRKPTLKIKYYNEHWNEEEKEFSGIIARVIQHEYDHIEGKLFIEHISTLKKTLIKGKLNDIAKGKVDVEYKMRFFRK